MTYQELSKLAHQEEEISKKVAELCRRPESEEITRAYWKVFEIYSGIHEAYAVAACNNSEALKRGLFIQWFALSEPNYLTGISVALNNENKLIECLYSAIDSGLADYELCWMLNYYFIWDWIFERLDSFKGFDSRIINDSYKLPSHIDREEMAKRGLMGKYWNSLTVFKEATPPNAD